MKVETKNPLELIETILKRNGINGMPDHISYDENLNSSDSILIENSSSHDGTLIFTHSLINEMFIPLINKQVIEREKYTEDELDNLRDLKYTLGTFTLESEYGIKVKTFEGMRDTVKLPVRIEYTFN